MTIIQCTASVDNMYIHVRHGDMWVMGGWVSKNVGDGWVSQTGGDGWVGQTGGDGWVGQP